jgi:hypothetical protein
MFIAQMKEDAENSQFGRIVDAFVNKMKFCGVAKTA